MKKIIAFLGTISLFSITFSNTFACNKTIQENTIEENQISYYTLSIGNGLFSYLKIGSKAILFDAGIGLDQFAIWKGRKHKTNQFASNFLKWTGVEEIETVFISHNHSDHYANLDAIAKNFKINNLVLPLNGNSLKNRFVSNREKSTSINEKIYLNSNTKLYNFEKTYRFLDIDFYNWSYSELNYMKGLSSKDENNASAIIYFKVNSKSILITGDAEQELGNRLLKNKESNFYKVDIYQVPHHGSKNALSNNFVKKVNPSICYVSGTNGDEKSYREWGGDHIFPTAKAYSNISSCQNRYLTGKVLSNSSSDKQKNDYFVNAEGAKNSDYDHQNASYEYRFFKNGSYNKYYFEPTVSNPNFLSSINSKKPDYETYLNDHSL
ncbi:competence protein ComEC [Spiroplasma gladiatoris]|uniref:Competence protein ComEC n=1 Tax=Spiroplasma gladiatoris TaxID=2143 RepID=A0A4V1AQA8_9MOLU|nr:MBL fold metallo-hydrolase [Spiroplasma gladiatoris]QBQ07849.1 competence protein ComEC [Spiroplasma gladiatoris]